jgi:hypothetical protein
MSVLSHDTIVHIPGERDRSHSPSDYGALPIKTWNCGKQCNLVADVRCDVHRTLWQSYSCPPSGGFCLRIPFPQLSQYICARLHNEQPKCRGPFGRTGSVCVGATQSPSYLIFNRQVAIFLCLPALGKYFPSLHYNDLSHWHKQ